MIVAGGAKSFRYSYALSPAGLVGIALLALTVLPVWCGIVFPSLDGPVHPYIADVLRHYPTSPYLQQFFAFNWNPDPNLLIYPILYALEGILAPMAAEKVLVTLIAISLFASSVYVMTALRADALVLSLLILPITFHHLLYKGFYNYSLSIAGFVFGFGYWWRWHDLMNPTRSAVLAAIALLTVLSHLMGLLLLGYTVLVVQCVLWLLQEDCEQRPTVGHLVRQVSWLGLAFLPASLLMLDFFWRYPPMPGGEEQTLSSFWLARQLVTMSVLYLFDPREALWLGPLLAGLGYLALFSFAFLRRPITAGLLAAILGLVLIYIWEPAAVRGFGLHDRLLPAIYILLVFWIVSGFQPERRSDYLAVAVLVAIVSVANAASRAWYHAKIGGYVSDYLSLAPKISPETTILSYEWWRPGQPIAGESLSWRVDPFRHMAANLATGKRAVFLGASLLSRNRYGYFPIYYRPNIDWIGPDHRPMDLAAYNALRERPVDYVILWPVVDGDLRPFGTLVEDLKRDYDLVARSTPLGLAFLYRHR